MMLKLADMPDVHEVKRVRLHAVSELPRRDIKVDLVFDIETEKFVTFVMGGLLWKGGAYKHFPTGHEAEMVRAIVESQGCVWAHFGGGFDFKWLLDWIVILYPDKFVDLYVANQRIIMIKVGRTRLYDSWALTMLSLEKFTKGLGIEKRKLSLPCDCERYCGGWCSMRVDMPVPLYRQAAEYMEFDCRSLMNALEALRGFAEDHDLDLGATIGSSAWRNAKRWLGLPDANWTDAEYDYIRLSYFGGRVQLLRRGIVDWVHYYDVNSMYPAMLKYVKMPTGDRYEGSGSTARQAYDNGLEGVFTCIVRVPDTYLPPLPLRYVKGSAKAIAYPTGTFKGTWTALELRAAEAEGVRVEILRGMWWSRAELIYSDWIDRIYSIREEYDKESPLGKFAKNYGNSFSGKCAARPDRHHYQINGEISACVCPCVSCRSSANDCRCEWGAVVLQCRCGSSTMVGDFVVATPYRQIDGCAHIHHAAYLTAAARCEWRRFANLNGAERTVYGDTDSLATIAAFQGSTNKIGGWKCEGKKRNFHGHAPKVYVYEDWMKYVPLLEAGPEPKNVIFAPDGTAWDMQEVKAKQEARAKGVALEKVPDRGHVFYTHDKGAVVELPKPEDEGRLLRPIDSPLPYSKDIIVGFRAGASANQFFTKQVLTRKLTARFGDRVPWSEQPDGTFLTRPKSIDEIVEEGTIIQAADLR